MVFCKAFYTSRLGFWSEQPNRSRLAKMRVNSQPSRSSIHHDHHVLQAITILILLFLLPLSHSAFSLAGFKAVNPGALCYVINSTITITVSESSGSGLSAEPDEITIPLKRAGRLLMMEARIDNETGNFIFDTGSSKLVLNNTYFRKYVSVESGERGGITGGVANVRQTKISRIQISGFSCTNVMADLTDLGHIENRRGIKILGLLGLSLLKNMEIIIDVSHNELHLYRLDHSGNRISKGSKEFKSDISQKIQMYQDVLFVSPKIGGKILSFCLDTGAESNVISSAAPKKVMNTVSITRRSGLVGSGRPSTEALYGILNDFVLGGQQLSQMETIITNLDNMSTAFGLTVDGMLGYDFFARGQICINLVRLEMKVCFNKSEKN
ncbi:MAG: pepsin/retropepsin-like aspartic protease family protein [Bacteroidetes bacterium]|nr:pepsin/retropepsin-like aspartic protease family protein [Bacteroidota bacterium]